LETCNCCHLVFRSFLQNIILCIIVLISVLLKLEIRNDHVLLPCVVIPFPELRLDICVLCEHVDVVAWVLICVTWVLVHRFELYLQSSVDWRSSLSTIYPSSRHYLFTCARLSSLVENRFAPKCVCHWAFAAVEWQLRPIPIFLVFPVLLENFLNKVIIRSLKICSCLHYFYWWSVKAIWDNFYISIYYLFLLAIQTAIELPCESRAWIKRILVLLFSREKLICWVFLWWGVNFPLLLNGTCIKTIVPIFPTYSSAHAWYNHWWSLWVNLVWVLKNYILLYRRHKIFWLNISHDNSLSWWSFPVKLVG